MSLDLINALAKHFHGRKGWVALSDDEGNFAPYELLDDLNEVLSNHVTGVQCAGFYLLDEDNNCYCSCVDLDNKPTKPDPQWQSKAQKVYQWLVDAGLSPLAEISQSGEAAHVWLFFQDGVPAWMVRSFWLGVSAQLGIPFAEVYPRQDALTGKGFGNLIRTPLWNKSKFVLPLPTGQWSDIDALKALCGVRSTTSEELSGLAFELGINLRPATPNYDLETRLDDDSREDLVLPARVQARLAEKSYSLLAKRWRGDTEGMRGADKSRTAIAYAIACELIRQHVPTPEIEAALLFWGRKEGCEERMRSPGWLSTTLSKAYETLHGRGGEKSADIYTMHDAGREYLKRCKEGAWLYFESGIKECDEIWQGPMPGEYWVIGARPGAGKTAMIMQWLDHQSRLGSRCMLVSEEMSALALGGRAVQLIAHCDREDFSDEAYPVIEAQVNTHYEERFPIILVEGCGNIDRLEEVVAEQVRVNQIELLAVDYLQLLWAEGGSEYDRVTEVSKRLNGLKKKHNLAILAACQLSRPQKGFDSKLPAMSDLKSSGQIEQDCDACLLLHRPSLASNKKKIEAEDDLTVICAKRRNGRGSGNTVYTKFDLKAQTIGVPE